MPCSIYSPSAGIRKHHGRGTETACPGGIERGISRRGGSNHLLAFLVACLASCGNAAYANDDPSAEHGAFKLTPSYYHQSDGNHAQDLNLRYMRGAQTAWLGYYQDRAGYRQARTGYEDTLGLAFGQITLSAQLAGGGFAGGSASAQIGGESFAIVGIGRTNLRDYYNLNFDPNDAITLGFGTRAIADSTLSLATTRDDRLHTGQQVTHLVLRHGSAETRRLTIDIFRKIGHGEDDIPVSAIGLALGWDQYPWFFHLARDPKVNFTSSDMLRVSVGRRF